MKDIRQGNDIRISWSIFKKDGQIFSLEGKNISLYLKSVFGRKELNDFVVTGNIIQWTFYGKDQKNTGKYSLEMVVNEGEKGMITTDKCDFVNLVSCSCKLQGGEDAPNVETESIELTSTLEYVSGGGDYDDTALWRALDGKVDKVEGLGLSEENYTTEEKEKLAGLENYDDSGIKGELAKKVESEVVVDTESTEDFEFGYDDTEIRQEIAELSAEVGNKQDTITDLETIRSGAAKGATALQSVPDEYATKQYVDNAISEIPQGGGGGASNEWKCVYDGRVEEGKSAIFYTTYADGTPLKAREAIIEVINDIKASADITGYVRIQSTLNKNKCSFGIITYESASVGDGKIMVQDVRVETSEHFFTKAYIAKDMKNSIAHNSAVGEEIGHAPQIFEDIVSIELASNSKLTEAAPFVRIYAR